MDVFIEKLVTKKKTGADQAKIAGLVFAFVVILFLAMQIKLLATIFPFLLVGLGYGALILLRRFSVEFEYSVTNGDMDIDKIMSKRKRKRVFSMDHKTMEILAPVKSDKFGEYKNVAKRLELCSSMQAQDLWFMVGNYKSERVMMIFEPDERMVESFYQLAPRKVIKK